MWMKVRFLHENAICPTRSHRTDAGVDVYCIENEVVMPHTDKIIKTGISMAIPDGWVAIVKERSGNATKKKVTVGACVIDSGYRGELLIHLFNNGDVPATFIMGDKIAQLVIVPCWNGEPEVVEELDDTPRGDGGFGSTDVCEDCKGTGVIGVGNMKDPCPKCYSIEGKRSCDIVKIGGTDCMLLGTRLTEGKTKKTHNLMDGKEIPPRPNGLSRKTDTPQSKKFWDTVDTVARQTDDWPQWKKDYAKELFSKPETRDDWK